MEKEVFNKVQEILEENNKTFISPSQNKYNFLLRRLVRCGYCRSVMSSHYSIKNGQKYFYYKCTRVMHRDKKACPTDPLSTREFENTIFEKIKKLSQDRKQLEQTLKKSLSCCTEGIRIFKEKENPFRKGKKRKRRRNQKAYQGSKGKES